MLVRYHRVDHRRTSIDNIDIHTDYIENIDVVTANLLSIKHFIDSPSRILVVAFQAFDKFMSVDVYKGITS